MRDQDSDAACLLASLFFLIYSLYNFVDVSCPCPCPCPCPVRVEEYLVKNVCPDLKMEGGAPAAFYLIGASQL